MRVTEKGQVTVPIDIREKMGILPNSEVEFVVIGKNVILRPLANQLHRGRRLTAAMRGKAKRGMTTDQIMALTRGR
jgi:AbrB family looped-hinge helix DNA binding protein